MAGERVLVVPTAPRRRRVLLDAVRVRAAARDCTFTLLVPRTYWDPDTEQAAATIELALPLIEEAAGGHVHAMIGDSDPFVAVRDALAAGDFSEVLISTLPERVSHWLHRDLPAKVEKLGLPVTVVTARAATRRTLRRLAKPAHRARDCASVRSREAPPPRRPAAASCSPPRPPTPRSCWPASAAPTSPRRPATCSAAGSAPTGPARASTRA